jgi:hypothetical protein
MQGFAFSEKNEESYLNKSAISEGASGFRKHMEC